MREIELQFSRRQMKSPRNENIQEVIAVWEDSTPAEILQQIREHYSYLLRMCTDYVYTFNIEIISGVTELEMLYLTTTREKSCHLKITKHEQE